MKYLSLIIVAAVAVAVLAGCSKDADRPYNLVLVTIDTLRPDRLGYEGHSRDTSPVIDALAREGVVFKNNYSVSGWTLPSVATWLTGRYPRDHGATDFHWSMDMRLPTLAGILRANGYDTHGYVSHVLLRPSYGVADGFSSYDYSVLNRGHPHDVATAKPLTDLALNGFGELEEPFFLWVHYFDPHFEYLSHRNWASFGDDDIDRYDQEIAQTDNQIGRIVARLREKRMYDRTIVVFTSDHGEEFGEHDSKYHYTLYDEVMRVPLVIRAPLLEPRVIAAPTEQIDLLPTILGMLKIELGEGRELPGRDMLAPGFAADAEKRPIFMERDRPPPYNQRGVVYDNHKLFVIEYADTSKIPKGSRGTHVPIDNVHPGIYLYDLANDPAERNNIFAEDHPKARELLQLLADHFSGDTPPAHPVDVDENLREKLRSLGYIR